MSITAKTFQAQFPQHLKAFTRTNGNYVATIYRIHPLHKIFWNCVRVLAMFHMLHTSTFWDGHLGTKVQIYGCKAYLKPYAFSLVASVKDEWAPLVWYPTQSYRNIKHVGVTMLIDMHGITFSTTRWGFHNILLNISLAMMCIWTIINKNKY